MYITCQKYKERKTAAFTVFPLQIQVQAIRNVHFGATPLQNVN